jgi:hypothetical protein
MTVVLSGAGCTTSKPPPASSAVPAVAHGSADQVSCNDLQYDANDPGTADAPTLCERYRDEFVPSAAREAVGCMRAAEWSICEVSRCATKALGSVAPENDARCAHVDQKCPGMGEHCATHIAGMKPAGRDRFAGCLVDNCDKGLRYCLWDPMTTPCDGLSFTTSSLERSSHGRANTLAHVR